MVKPKNKSTKKLIAVKTDKDLAETITHNSDKPDSNSVKSDKALTTTSISNINSSLSDNKNDSEQSNQKKKRQKCRQTKCERRE